MPEPRILAGFVQGTLEIAREAERERGLSILSRLPGETLGEIDAAMAIAWLPAAHDVALTEAIFAEAGPERGSAIFREAMARSMSKGFLSPLVRGAVSLLGRSPERLLRWSSKVWGTIYRDAGELALSGEDADGKLRLELLHAPPLLREHRTYLLGTASAIEGAMAALQCEVTCHLELGVETPTVLVRSKRPGAAADP